MNHFATTDSHRLAQNKTEFEVTGPSRSLIFESGDDCWREQSAGKIIENNN